jgi:hypothetical protein
VEYLFDRIGAYRCSRDRFARLLAAALHPLCVRGEYQEKLANEISAVLVRDGYALVRVGEESSFPIYSVTPAARGVAGAAKNLVFASNGPKPEIGFADAINNDIKILSNEDSCLVYDRPIRRDGLLWSEVVEWWAAREATPHLSSRCCWRSSPMEPRWKAPSKPRWAARRGATPGGADAGLALENLPASFPVQELR